MHRPSSLFNSAVRWGSTAIIAGSGFAYFSMSQPSALQKAPLETTDAKTPVPECKTVFDKVRTIDVAMLDATIAQIDDTKANHDLLLGLYAKKGEAIFGTPSEHTIRIIKVEGTGKTKTLDSKGKETTSAEGYGQFVNATWLGELPRIAKHVGLTSTDVEKIKEIREIQKKHDTAEKEAAKKSGKKYTRTRASFGEFEADYARYMNMRNYKSVAVIATASYVGRMGQTLEDRYSNHFISPIAVSYTADNPKAPFTQKFAAAYEANKKTFSKEVSVTKTVGKGKNKQTVTETKKVPMTNTEALEKTAAIINNPDWVKRSASIETQVATAIENYKKAQQEAACPSWKKPLDSGTLKNT